MSQQLQITGGAKVRDLQDVIIGTSGVLSSLAFNVANGVPKLDVNGKILVSQLPNSVMEYQGTWNAATNTPTLVNGTGNQGDVYLCNVAGTTNFGAGPITFAVGDSAIYSGTIWQRAGGATGTVTSVGLTSTGNDAITITGSPVTTNGTINLGFAGTNLQYINGTGDLTTFPTLISSIGLSMPSAFSVANSPLTSNGTIAVTGAGYPSQYIRGDGTLADFPTSGGGGSSVSYYLNGGTSQGTIGGVTYYEMSKTADTGTGVDFNKTGDGFIVAFLTDAGDPAQLNIPAGNWNYEIYASMSANGGTPEMYAELYKYDGTTFTLISTSSNEILYDGTNLNLYTFAMTVLATTLSLTDRLAVKLYATNSGGKTTTVHTQDSHLCQIITTFSTGITALNGLTAQVQYFATGTSGTDFNISSTTATHTFNIPSASATNRGLITTGSQTIAGDKTFSGSIILNGGVDMNNSLNVNSGFFIRNNVIGSTLYTSFSINKASNIETVQFLYSTGFASNLLFNDAATYSYSFPTASGTIALTSNLSSYVPYTGATANVDLGAFSLTASSVGGAGIFGLGGGTVGGYLALKKGTTLLGNITDYSSINANGTKYVFISDAGSTNYKSASFELGSLTNNTARTYTLPDASGTIALVGGTGVGTVTSVAALTLGTSGTDLSSSVANGTTTPVITLNVPTASATNRGALSSADWTTFNNKQAALTNPVTGTGTSGQVTYFNGTSTVVGSSNHFWDATNNRLGINTSAPIMTLHVNGEIYINNWATFNSTNVNGWYATMQSSGTAFAYLGSTGQFAATGGTATDFGIRSQNAIAFYTNGGNERIRITSAGNVGIGTTSPSCLLHLQKAGGTGTIIQRIQNESIDGYSGTHLYGSDGVLKGHYGWANTSAGTLADKMYFGTIAAKDVVFTSNDTERMRITSGGNVLIGTTSDDGSIWRLQVATNADVGLRIKSSAAAYTSRIELAAAGGGASVINAQGGANTLYVSANNTNGVYITSGATSWTGNSDERLKDITGNIENAIDSLMALRTVKHTWKSDESKKEHLALIAQDVEKVFPQVIDKNKLPSKADDENPDETEYLGVRYTELVPVLVKAIQEQQAIITSLQDRLDRAGL